MATSNSIDLQETVDQTANWNWEDQHVMQAFTPATGLSQKQQVAIQDIIESGTTLIAAGPADLGAAMKRVDVEGATGGFRVVPIGLLESAQVSMNKPLSRIFEIGSKLSYIIPGRTVGGMSLTRVFFDGPSLMKALYFGEVFQDYATKDKKYAQFQSSLQNEDPDTYGEYANIGSGNLAMNLASSFFDQPVGLAFFFKDKSTNTVGQIYFEGCTISTYTLGIAAGMNVLTESVNLEFVRCRPILTNATYDAQTTGQTLSDLNIISEAANNPA